MIFVLIFMNFFLNSFSAEVDNFSDRDKKHIDVTYFVNHFINSQIQLVIKKLNQSKNAYSDNCKNKDIFDYVESALDNNFTELDYELNHKIPNAYSVDQSKSVYQNAQVSGCCNIVVSVRDHQLGLDKISHMFGNGFMLYSASLKFKNQNEAVKAALKEGLSQENGMWGLAGTSVKSYGDLAADYNGYLFYKNIYGSKDSYITCANGVYKQIKSFNLLEYVDDSWDEAINCSSFSDVKTQKIISENIRKITDGKECPLNQSICSELRIKYGEDVASFILHPNCFNLKKQKILVEKPAKLGVIDAVKQAPGFILFEAKKAISGWLE